MNPTRFDPDQLRAQLRSWEDSTELSLTPEERAFCRYYGIDFCTDSGDDELKVSQSLGTLSLADFKIATHLFSPERPVATVVLVHGYYDHHGLYGHLIRYCLKRNFRVVAFDLPGHGLSSGPRAFIRDFRTYQAVLEGVLNYFQPRLPGLWHLLGQSTGAAIISQYLLEQSPPSITQAVLLAPLVRPQSWFWVNLANLLLRPWLQRIPRRFSANSGDTGFVEFLHRRDPLQCRTVSVPWVNALAHWINHFYTLEPIPFSPLIIQGQEDTTVDWIHNLTMLEEKFENPQILYLEQAQHHLANETALIRDRYCRWLDRYWE